MLELKQKHVSEDVIRQTLEEDETDERDQLKALIAKKRGRYPDRQKLMQYLARQGFRFDDIKSALQDDAIEE
jgi:regulatory protein